MHPAAVISCIVAVLGWLLSASTGGAAETRLGGIRVPPGFRIALYAEVPDARSMTLGERGTLFVGTRNPEGGKAWGRPVDVQEMPDGSLLVSDDKGGRIYRISYKGESGASRLRTGKKRRDG